MIWMILAIVVLIVVLAVQRRPSDDAVLDLPGWQWLTLEEVQQQRDRGVQLIIVAGPDNDGRVGCKVLR